MPTRLKHAKFALQGKATLMFGSYAVGETEDGIAIEIAMESTEYNKADQLSGLSGRFVVGMGISVRCNLARFTAESLHITLGGDPESMPQAGVGGKVTVVLQPPTLLPTARLVILGHRADGVPVRVVLPAAEIVPGTSWTQGKANRALLPTTFEGTLDPATEDTLGTIVWGEYPI